MRHKVRSRVRCRHIDAFCHFFPQGIFKKLSETTGGTRDVGKRMQGVRTIYDLDARFRIMDGFEDYSQVLSLGLPPIEGMVGPDKTPEFARVANDGLAELCAKYPDRFCGYVGALPMDKPDAAAREAERILINGNANGLQLHTNVNGPASTSRGSCRSSRSRRKPTSRSCCIRRASRDVPGFPGGEEIRYEIWTIFGWPYETSATMARLIFSGVMTKFPRLKVMAHHLGAMIPFFDQRIDTGWATLGSRTSDEDYSDVLPKPRQAAARLLQGFLRRHRAVRRPHRPRLRARFLRRRPCAVRLRRAVRPEEGRAYIRDCMAPSRRSTCR